MISKANYPRIDIRDQIKVEGNHCIVTHVYGNYSLSGACEVVTDPAQPINRDVWWDGKQWTFSPQPTLFNAAKTSRLKAFVDLLQNS